MNKFKQYSALSIARPLNDGLSNHPFSGHVFSRFERTCNLIDANHRIITLTSPGIGNGPFSIVIEPKAEFFKTIDPNQPVLATPKCLKIGDWNIELTHVEIWEPKLPHLEKPLNITASIGKILEPYNEWPCLRVATPAARKMTHLARQAADELNRALVRPQNIEAATAQLAGLGSGLTPAGDDYLVGVMAALWLIGETNLPSQIAKVAAPKTTTLSAAFLTAAARGEFVEPWHNLVQAFKAGDDKTVEIAVNRIAEFGASSGIDALAGFTSTVLATALSGSGLRICWSVSCNSMSRWPEC